MPKQVGNGFEEYKLDTGAYAFNVYQTKISNKEELAKALEQDSKNMACGMYLNYSTYNYRINPI